MAVTGPAELSAAATLITFWNPDVNVAVWYAIFIVLIAGISFFGVRVYGEVSSPIPQVDIANEYSLRLSSPRSRFSSSSA